MSTLTTGLNTAIRGWFASILGQIYYANNFDAVKVWNGITTSMQDAGITGPAAAMASPSAASGNCTNGRHRFRYRYRNTKTGYVSNPSPERRVTVSGGNGELTFTTVASSDGKVDAIDIEATAVNGSTWYRIKTIANTTSAVVSMSDSNLIQQFNVDANYGSVETGDTYSHEVPPVGAFILSYKGRSFIGGDEAYTITGTFTNSSTSVTGTGYSTKWVGRQVRVSGETVSYIISAATTTVLTLASAWSGSTGSKTASVYSVTPNRVYWSRIGMPESFYAAVQASDRLQNRSDQMTGAWGRKDGLYIFGKYSSERWIFNDDPSVAVSQTAPIQGNRGVFHQRCLVEADGKLYAWDRPGIYQVGEKPDHISANVDAALTELCDYDQSTKFHGVFDPRDRVLMWFFVVIGDTQPKRAVCYELDTGRMFFYRFLQGITASSVVPTSDGQVRVLLGDENGYSWFFGVDGSFDGVPPATSSVLTASGTPTTSVISVTQTLPTSPNLAGVMLYQASSDQYRVIASNTSSQITLASALSSAPVAGDTLYIGAIPFEYRTKWWVGQGLETKKAPVYFFVKLYPGSATGKMRVFFYEDFSSTPTTVTATASDVHNDGLTVTNATTYIELDLDGGSGDGFVAVPLSITWKRALQARLYVIRPDGDLRIMDAGFSLTKGGEQTVANE